MAEDFDTVARIVEECFLPGQTAMRVGSGDYTAEAAAGKLRCGDPEAADWLECCVMLARSRVARNGELRIDGSIPAQFGSLSLGLLLRAVQDRASQFPGERAFVDSAGCCFTAAELRQALPKNGRLAAEYSASVLTSLADLFQESAADRHP